MTERWVKDFGYDPTDGLMWVELDEAPDRAWVDSLDRALDDEIHRFPAVMMERTRVYLPARRMLEADGLSLLTSYVAVANERALGRAISEGPPSGLSARDG